MKKPDKPPARLGAGEPLKHLRRICLEFPESHETRTFGNPTFQVGRKTFAVLDHYSGRRCICFKATLEEQARLCRDPRFFFAPYGGQHGWTCLQLATLMDWDEVAALVEQSYRLVATKRQIRALDAPPEPVPEPAPVPPAPGSATAARSKAAPGKNAAATRKAAPGKSAAATRKAAGRKSPVKKGATRGTRKPAATRKKK